MSGQHSAPTFHKPDSAQVTGIAAWLRAATFDGLSDVKAFLSRVFLARRHVRKQGRFDEATGGGALGGRAAILLEFEQGQLPQLRGFPR
jgi:DNA-directed RNA polymerase specialized sigma24 family protein